MAKKSNGNIADLSDNSDKNRIYYNEEICKKFGVTRRFPCGKKNLLDMLRGRKPIDIKNLEGNTLYRGYGKNFQTVLEQAVKKGIELPKADLKNKVFVALEIEGAKLEGASFENSKIYTEYKKLPDKMIDLSLVVSKRSSLASANLKDVCFKNTYICEHTVLSFADFEKADFKDAKVEKNKTLKFAKNLDKAKNVDGKLLKKWKKNQKDDDLIAKARFEYQEGLLEAVKTLHGKKR